MSLKEFKSNWSLPIICVLFYRREERHLQKSLEAEKWAFKQKQEKELQVKLPFDNFYM